MIRERLLPRLGLRVAALAVADVAGCGNPALPLSDGGELALMMPATELPFRWIGRLTFEDLHLLVPAAS
jgi:hypothetical protein